MSTSMTNDEIRAEVRAWLDENWTAEWKAKASIHGKSAFDKHDDGGWGIIVRDALWAAPSWPVEHFGRGWTKEQSEIVAEEFARVGAPGSDQDRLSLYGNTILTFGTDELKAEMLPRLLTTNSEGGIRVCLLYSEPGSGSDLASVRTRGERQGDEWIINGQKVWTSGAKDADYGMLLCRTDWDVPKHKGMTFFFFPMLQDGVDIRPIHQVTGESHFNEVFLDDCRVPHMNMLGREGEGWKVLQTALAYERLIMGEASSAADNTIDMIDMARKAGNLNDPILRQDIARAMALRAVNQLNMDRATADMQQGTSSPLMSMGKLSMSRILHGEARVATAILGVKSMLTGADNPDENRINRLMFLAYMTSIGGGSDQIQRNIIAERVLGLPREIEMDRDIPFRESRAVKG